MEIFDDMFETMFLWVPLAICALFVVWAIAAGIKIGIEILVDKIKSSKKKG